MNLNARVAVALTLVLSLSAPVFAQTLSPAQQQEVDEGRMLEWLGGALFVAGVLFETLSYTALANSNQDCVATSYYASTFATCTTTKTTNWAVMTGGIGLAASGIVFMVDGRIKRRRAVAPSLTFGPHRVAAGVNITFR